MENSTRCQDKLAELADKYNGVDAWTAVASAVSAELADAVQQLKNKQAERFFKDDERELRSVLDSVTQHLTQVGCWWWCWAAAVAAAARSCFCAAAAATVY